MTKTKKQKAGNSSSQNQSLSKKTVRQLANEIRNVSVSDKPKKARRKKSRSTTASKNFGPVSTISTAPVAIGNSVRGATKNITRTKDGVRIVGRDFMFSPMGTGSITTWTMCGGSPLTPAAFADSIISTHMRMYMKYKFHSFTVHYITSSPTSASGDVMFYYSKDRSSVFLNQTSSQLLPFVFTDQNTVLGPQWTNHSARFTVTGDWKLCDYGMHDGIEEYADGEVFLLSKTSTSDSPGYVVFDYDMEFAQQSFQPRLLTFPLPKIQWKQMNLAVAGAAVTGSTDFELVVSGNDISGSASTGPLNPIVGDLFKVIIDATNSAPGSWSNSAGTAPTVSNLIAYNNGGYSNSVGLVDGFTFYAQYISTNRFKFYPNATSAFTQAQTVKYGLSSTLTVNLQCWLSYIGTNDDAANFSNF